MRLSDLKHLHVTELIKMATANEIDGANRMRKQDLIFALLKNQAKKARVFMDKAHLKFYKMALVFYAPQILLI